MSFISKTAAMAVCLALAGLPAIAKQWGMVVGVDDYLHFQKFPAPPGELSDLEGAVNDATRIAGAMRQTGIDLPDHRILLDDRATLENFQKGWNEMLAKAKSSDTIIVSFSGHGAQEREIDEPFDEITDGLDETIMFHEFDPRNPRIGRLSDDQLRDMLVKASAFRVIWVMDSCHSAGLTRQVNRENMGLTRNGGIWDIPIEPIEGEIKAGEGDTGKDDLPHVTQILATASEDRLVTETRFDGKAHGALSWYFAEALTGAADLDGDKSVSRSEIAEYLQDRVFTHMNQNQQPRILPRGDSQALLSLLPLVPPKPQEKQAVAVKFKGAKPPGLDRRSYVEVTTSPSLVFENTGGKWDVFNHTGDQITTIDKGAQRLISRARALDDVLKAKKPGIPPVVVEALHENKVVPIGERVGYVFKPPAEDMRFLTLFNIASDGTLQYLHPAPGARDDPVDMLGISMRFDVVAPTGADQIVAVFCKRPPLDLRKTMQAFNGRTVPRNETLKVALQPRSCQVGVVGLYTKAR